jgi:hypothetical protein
MEHQSYISEVSLMNFAALKPIHSDVSFNISNVIYEVK